MHNKKLIVVGKPFDEVINNHVCESISFEGMENLTVVPDPIHGSLDNMTKRMYFI
jgi:hypothetical protein